MDTTSTALPNITSAGMSPAGFANVQKAQGTVNASGQGAQTTTTGVALTPNQIASNQSASSTVLSNYNYSNDTKPGLDSALSNLSNKGTVMGADGVARTADGQVYTPPPPPIPAGYQGQLENGQVPQGATDASGNTINPGPGYTLSDPDANGQQHYYQYSSDPAQENLYQNMVANLDANTKAQVDTITQQYKVLKAQQASNNTAAAASRAKSLLLGGSSRYAQLSSAGEMDAQRAYGLQEIADLDAKENSAIATAKTAQQNGDQAVYQDALKGAQQARADKQASAQKLIDKQDADIQKGKEAQVQSLKDEAVAKALALDPKATPEELLSTLNTNSDGGQNGNGFTAKDVSDAMKNLAPAGDLTKLAGGLGDYYKLVQDGVPLPPEIAALPPEQQPYAYVQYEHNLTVKQTTPKAPAQKPDPNYKMQLSTWNELVGTGLKPQEVGALQHDIQTYGLNAVLTNPNTQLTEDQKTHIRSEYVKTRNPTTMLPPASSSSSSSGGP